MSFLVVAAARPNFVKVAPVLNELRARDITASLVHTGQHYDFSMSDSFFVDLGIAKPDFHLGIGSGSHAEQTGAVMVAFEQLLELHPSDAVIVFGDVNSTLACALVAAKAGTKIVHVEAGLRSGDWSMPEEINRVVTDRVSDLLLAPSADAVENLIAEGFGREKISLVGNVMIDSLYENLERAEQSEAWQRNGVKWTEYGLVTLHRPHVVDSDDRLEELLKTLNEVAEVLPLVFPVHPRTARRLPPPSKLHPNLSVSKPLGYLDFIGLMSKSKVVLTDSGGIQEETTALGIPCLTLRENTERPITIAEGTNHLVGFDRDVILTTFNRVIRGDFRQAKPKLWDGKASVRIVDALVTAFA